MVSLNNRSYFNPNQHDLSKIVKDELDSAKAYSAGIISGIAINSLGIPLVKKMVKTAHSDKNPQLNKTINTAVDKVLVSTGLSKKGVEIQNLNTGYYLLGKRLGEKQKIKSIIHGLNASFNTSNNSILVNRDIAPIFCFHEMGHAFNKNCTKLWKQIQKTRRISFLVPTFLLYSIAFDKKEKPKEGKELTKLQKIKNFIIDKSPEIAAISTLPMVLEELRASLRANEWGKKVLDKNLLKKLNKTNALAFLSYVLATISAYASVKIAKTAKEHLSNKNKNISYDKRPSRMDYHQG